MASDVQLATGPFSPNPLRFDVSEVVRIRKRVGRASASLKFIGWLFAIAVLFGLDTYVRQDRCTRSQWSCGMRSVLCGQSAALRKYRSGNSGGGVVWAGFNGFDALPKAWRNGIDGFSVYFANHSRNRGCEGKRLITSTRQKAPKRESG